MTVRWDNVRILVLDVDGVLTTGAMFYDDAGHEWKQFHTHDGMGIDLLHRHNIPVAFVTQEKTSIVERRAAKLNVTEVHQGVTDKLVVVEELLARHDIAWSEACYIGDDVNDLSVMRKAGVAVSVPNAHHSAKDCAHYVTRKAGGQGAVREVCDLIMAGHSLEER